MLNQYAREWVAALRSGEYKQGQGYLVQEDIELDQNLFCCLGVACDLAVKDGFISPPVMNADRGEWEYDGNDVQTLPLRVFQRLGLVSDMGAYQEWNEGKFVRQRFLTEDNDRYDLTFQQIADIIESEPKRMFSDA